VPKKRKKKIVQTEDGRSNVAHLVAHPMKTASDFSDVSDPSACRTDVPNWPDPCNQEIEDDGFVTVYFSGVQKSIK